MQLPPQYNVEGFQWQDVNVSGTGGDTIVQPLPAPKAEWRLYLPSLGRGVVTTNRQEIVDTLGWWLYLPATSR